MYIIIAILAFGILIADHELGHFMAAKACGVKVNEFSVGMGPAIVKKQKGETLYALRLLPLGGYCAMEGEDEASEDSRSFFAQAPWKKAIILVAGAAMNYLLGLVIIILLYSTAQGFFGTTVTSLVDGYKYPDDGLVVGDTIVSIDGHRTYYYNDIGTYLARAGDSARVTVERDGRRTELVLKKDHYTVGGEDAYIFGITGRNFIEGTPLERLKYSCYTAHNFVRTVWMSLGDLISGNVGVKELSGVVGIVSTINEVATESEAQGTRADALLNIAYLMAFIAINLSVMNLLPIPALDGGRILFLVIDTISEKLFHKTVNPKIEQYVNAGGLVLLLGLMAYVMFNDVMKIIR